MKDGADIGAKKGGKNEMKDTIYRQDAIDALDCINGTEEVLRSLPSAQPEPCADTISRTAAIDAVSKGCQELRGVFSRCEENILALPSVQPEQCEDAVSRQAAIEALMAWEEYSFWDGECLKHRGEPFWVAPSDVIKQLPSAQPYSEAEIQKMKDLEQAQIEQAFELGREEGQKEAQLEQRWIPCTDPTKLPKNKVLWITCEICGCRVLKEIYWDMTEWSDDVSGLIAYMPYVEPKPYREEGNQDE